jgi:hypothetical protein
MAMDILSISQKMPCFMAYLISGQRLFLSTELGGSTITITLGYMLGCTNPEMLEKDYCGIDPGAF